MSGKDEPLSICVVTQPGLSDSNSPMETQTESLSNILNVFGFVTILGLGISEESGLRKRHTVIDVAAGSFKDSILAAALQYIVNQLRLCRAIRRDDPDVVILYGCGAYLLPAVASRSTSADTITLVKGDVPRACYNQWCRRVPDAIAATLAAGVRLLERMTFAVSTTVACYTPSMAQSMGLNPADPDVNPRAARYVDTQEFSAETRIEDRPRRVVFVGRMHAEKRVQIIDQAAARRPDTEFVFVGDGPCRNQIDETRANVRVEGWQPHEEIAGYLNSAQALVLTSTDTEGLPTVILEAFACGTPVIAPPINGIPDVLSDGLTGYQLPEVTPEGLSRQIGRLLDNDSLPQMSLNARRVAEDRFAFEAAVERYGRLLGQRTMEPLPRMTTDGVDRTAEVSS